MGDYRGRRRGRSASEPSQNGAHPQDDDQSGYQGNGYYADEAFGGSNYRDEYQESGPGVPGEPDGYAEDYASDYAEPRFDFQQRPAARPEPAPYAQPYEQPYEQLGDQYARPYGAPAPGYETVPGYDPEQFYAPDPEPFAAPRPEPSRGSRRGRPAVEPEFAPGYAPGYAPEDPGAYTPGYDDMGYTEGLYDTAAYGGTGYADSGYAEPGYDAPPYAPGPLEAEPLVPPQSGSRRRGSRRGRPADEGAYAPGYEPEPGGYGRPDGHDPGYEQGYEPGYDPGHDAAGRPGADVRDRDRDEYGDHDPGLDAERRPRADGPAPNHLPFVAVAAVALIASGFVAPKATAAVTILLQIAAAFGVRDILRMPGRRSAIVAVIPAVGATVGTFGFTSDVAASSIAAGIGAGFVLAAGDMVLKTRRRGVHNGAARDLAATVTALLIACMTAMLTAAARQSATAVAIGGVLYGVLALAASRNRELTFSRAAVLGLPAAAGALAAYAAAILVA